LEVNVLPSIITSVRDALNSGAAEDVLCALNFRSALESGELPSKEGMSRLVELGFACTDYNMHKAHRLTVAGKIVASEYYKALISEGQEVAGTRSFTMRELRPLLTSNVIRWMSSKVDSAQFLLETPNSQMYHLFDQQSNPAFESFSYRSAETEGTPWVRIDLTVGDRGVEILVSPRSI